MTRLVISSVTDVTFGRHDRRSFTGLDSDFVVIHGPNESGKSTLAEFLCWAIGGPSRSFADNSNIFRRGSEDRVGGRVRGTLGSDMVDIDATFALKMRGLPGDERLSTVGKQRFDGASIAQRFGGIEPLDYRLMYWLYGGDLGTIGSVSSFSAVLSRYALGSAGTDTDVSALLGRISSSIRAQEQDAKAARGLVKAVNGEINEVAGRPAELAAAQDRVQELRGAEDDTMQRQEDEREQRVLLTTVRDGLVHIATHDMRRASRATHWARSQSNGEQWCRTTMTSGPRCLTCRMLAVSATAPKKAHVALLLHAEWTRALLTA
jgi:energy-coupling factor transporter ATP-binding protein EcfA2